MNTKDTPANCAFSGLCRSELLLGGFPNCYRIEGQYRFTCEKHLEYCVDFNGLCSGDSGEMQCVTCRGYVLSPEEEIRNTHSVPDYEYTKQGALMKKIKKLSDSGQKQLNGESLMSEVITKRTNLQIFDDTDAKYLTKEQLITRCSYSHHGVCHQKCRYTPCRDICMNWCSNTSSLIKKLSYNVTAQRLGIDINDAAKRIEWVKEFVESHF